MTHIKQSLRNPNLFWATDKIGETILVDIWKNLQMSPMDDGQLLIHKDEREKAKKLFLEYGFTFNL
jgi:hypothetical protein